MMYHDNLHCTYFESAWLFMRKATNGFLLNVLLESSNHAMVFTTSIWPLYLWTGPLIGTTDKWIHWQKGKRAYQSTSSVAAAHLLHCFSFPALPRGRRESLTVMALRRGGRGSANLLIGWLHLGLGWGLKGKKSKGIWRERMKEWERLKSKKECWGESRQKERTRKNATNTCRLFWALSQSVFSSFLLKR